MLIASPWSRGGQVCSQVFDHTSVLQFLEVFLKKKYGKDVTEKNISHWRRVITGDLTAAFKSYNGEGAPDISFLDKKPFIEKIYNAKFKKEALDFKQLSKEEINRVNENPCSSSILPDQEPGVKPSCALPYQLYADGKLSDDKQNLGLIFLAKNEIFGKNASGSPFNVLFPEKYASKGTFENVGSRSYAVAAGTEVAESFPVKSFENGIYKLKIYGPNGFFRELSGNIHDPELSILCEYERPEKLVKKLSGNIDLKLSNNNRRKSFEIGVRDNAYKNKSIRKVLTANKASNTESIILNLNKSFGWYDFSVLVKGYDHFERRYAGHVETGNSSFTDPFMGRS
jgi:phospholipase C